MPAAAWIPLTGADCFLRAFDDEIRRKGRASHVSQFVLSTGRPFDLPAFERVIAEVSQAQPIVRAPIRRRGGFGVPAYALRDAPARDAPRVIVHDAPHRDPGALPPKGVMGRLNEPISLRRGELLRFDVVRYADGDEGYDLVATWAHLLFDGAGSERFLVWLDECYRKERTPAELPSPGELDPPDPNPLGARERGQRARAWQRWTDALSDHPLRSPAGPLRKTRQDLRYELLTLDHAETLRVGERAAEHAGFLTPMLFYLAAAIRAHQAVFRHRGVDPGSYAVPLPVNLRPKGREGAMFRTHTSLIWFQVLPEIVADLPRLIEVLKAQRRDAIRAGHIENGAYAMDFARVAPRRLYSHMARATLRGELCSFFFAYTGEFAEGMDTFFGAPVANGHHVAPVPPSPGSCVAVNLFRGRLNATHVYQHGVMSAPERACFRAQLRADFLGTRSELS